jgi:hypothetical protein
MNFRLLFVVAGVVFANAAGAQNWHEDALFGLHYDLHPNAQDTELGRETTYEHVRAMLEKVKPDFVQYDCKGHPGYTGYPTEVGSPSPGIVNDALKIWRQVTRDMGIPLSIHYSGVWDTRAIELHPEWGRIDQNGNRDTNNTCRSSAYESQLMIPQLLEVIRKYDIDGMWIDGENWASRPCWCEQCTKAFTEKTGIAEIPKKKEDAHWFDWLQFHRDLFTRHVTNVVNAVHAAKPTCMVTSNWMYSVREPEPAVAPVDYLSGDFDPSFGAERACAESRFISSRGKPWDLMAWSFLRTGKQAWNFKPAPHLCQELAVVLAQGGSVFIYDVPQRSGRLTEWHQDVLGQVADFCRERKAWSFKTATMPQVAILHSESSYYRHNDPLFNFGPANKALEGALHALLDNGYSVDLLNEASLMERMKDYRAIVIPEMEEVPDSVKQALETWVKGGGRLFLSGSFVAAQYGTLAGVAPGEAVTGISYVPADNGAVTIAAPFQAVTLQGAQQLAPLLSQQEPEPDRQSTAAATINKVGEGVVVAVHGPAFESYYEAHYPRLRRFIGDCFEAMNTPGLIQVKGPWWIEMSARRRDGKKLIQLVNRGAAGYLDPKRNVVEDVPDTGPFTVVVPCDEKPKRCYLEPDEAGLEWSWRAGAVEARISGLKIHNVLVIE